MKIKNITGRVIGVPAYEVKNGKVVRVNGNLPVLPDESVDYPQELAAGVAVLKELGFITVENEPKRAALEAEEAGPEEIVTEPKKASGNGRKRTAKH